MDDDLTIAYMLGGERERDKVRALEAEIERLKTLLRGIYLSRSEPLAPHHAGAIREALGYESKAQMLAALRGEKG